MTSSPQSAAFLGPEYSYSHLAALKHYGEQTELSPVGTIGEVFEAVDRGVAPSGIVPMDNSTDGRVVDTMERFLKHDLTIQAEVYLLIEHAFLISGDFDSVREVQSKPQALSQCRGWLAQNVPSGRLREVSSTAQAATNAANDPAIAAIASKNAGIALGLKVHESGIQDDKTNVTRFVVIGKSDVETAEFPSVEYKTDLILEIAHKPGALADALQVFKNHQLNMTWIESFPVPGAPTQYIFFMELVGFAHDPSVDKALSDLEREVQSMRVLGTFPRMNHPLLKP
ncbi:MAG: prephenate dehydratase domain-containing protein [Planctomycetota bacterium]